MERYRAVLTSLRANHFLDPGGSNLDQFEASIAAALRTARSHQGAGPLFGDADAPPPDPAATPWTVPDRLADDLVRHMDGLPDLLAGTVKSNHPRMVKNVIPTPTLAYLSSYVAAAVYMGNGVSAEDAGAALQAEIDLARLYAGLAGYDGAEAGGLFTFGGTATNLYAFRMGLLNVDPDALLRGVSRDVVVVGSRPAHYSHQTAVSWLGLGRDNYLMARSHRDQTTDLEDLDRICRAQIAAGRRIACIVGVGGTTSCMGIDDFAQLSGLIDRLVEDFGLPYRPHLHADSVIGWAYLHFSAYDFAGNPLGFREEVLGRLWRISSKIRTLRWADSFGIDFHKTGYAPYVSSMLVAKRRAKLAALGRESDMMTPLFHDAVAYNPGKYSLETSRSSANMVATLMSVSALGLEGFQVLLGHAQDISMRIKRDVGRRGSGLLVVNPDSSGSDVFIRAYPPEMDGDATFRTEMSCAAARKAITDYNDAFFQFLGRHYASGETGLAVSKTSAAFYTEAGDPVVALRLYILNPFLDAEAATDLVDTLAEAKTRFDAGRAVETRGSVTPPAPETATA
ncbi:hypothetical protein [Phenylobacterium sp.]|uniref:hypothetical protein n=1 Tax=Phenylobacterium sp. TaxID=1871053 RepID=UPI002CF8D765|nr:hypothetical protein [Phenylobacterium sp.]HLZ74944.1 hypothetical protein [Phenylobacterium sp.]